MVAFRVEEIRSRIEMARNAMIKYGKYLNAMYVKCLLYMVDPITWVEVKTMNKIEAFELHTST